MALDSCRQRSSWLIVCQYVFIVTLGWLFLFAGRCSRHGAIAAMFRVLSAKRQASTCENGQSVVANCVDILPCDLGGGLASVSLDALFAARYQDDSRYRYVHADCAR